MSRSISEIQAEMDAQQALQSGLSGLNSPSKVAIYTLWKYIMSASIWAHEQLWDIFKVELETIADTAPVATTLWVKNKTLEFQYSATVPQVVQVVNYVPAYAVVDTTLQIITRCSVKTLPNRIASVKVAKSDPPVALAALELTSLQGYLDDISPAGIEYSVTSAASDKLMLEATIYYNGQYAGVISDTVQTAINDYLESIPFDGYVRISSLIDAVQSVAGVTDIVIENLAMRADTVLIGSATYLVLAGDTVYNKYPTFAGYVIEETTATYTFADKLTFTPES